MIENREYIGDSVYIEYDGWAFAIMTNNGYEDENVIYLEPSVIENLIHYIDKIKRLKGE